MGIVPWPKIIRQQRKDWINCPHILVRTDSQGIICAGAILVFAALSVPVMLKAAISTEPETLKLPENIARR